MNIRTIMTAGLVGLAVAPAALASNSYAKWATISPKMRAYSPHFGVGAYHDALANVVTRYHNNPSDFYFEQTYDDTSVSLYNLQNEVWFSDDPDCSPAVTIHTAIAGVLFEADVIFYTGVKYTASMNKTSLLPYGGSYRPFETTAAHEYGHAAGLDHENDEYNIMGDDWNHIHCNGDTCRSYVGEDACDELVDLYGRYSGGSIQDLSVTLFRYMGTDGEYSTHKMGKMYTSAGGALSADTYNGQPRYSVSKSQQVQVQFTYENEGETTQSPNIAFYISTNSTISTGDSLIGSGTVGESRDNVHEGTSTVTIPSSLTSGQTYYLGVIIDYDNKIAEVDASNNAAYHIIKIK